MTLYTSSLGRPVQGVSQNPEVLRTDGQSAELENTIPIFDEGLVTRYGTVNVKEIMDSVHRDSTIHYYNRGDEESYFIVLEPDGSMRIFGVDGLEHIVANAVVVTITNGGSGYTSTPTVTFGAGASSTSLIEGTAVVVDEVVTAVIITDHGVGYVPSDTPSLAFSSGGGSNAAGTVAITPNTYRTKILDGGVYNKDISMTTVLDTTFITNRTIEIERGITQSDALEQTAMVTCSFANYGRTYEIFLDEVSKASFLTPDGDTASDIQQVDTSYVATQLYNDLIADVVSKEVTITAGGSGYTSPTVVFTGGSGTGMTGTASQTGGVVDGITITNYGTGYELLDVIIATISDGGPGVNATATVDVVWAIFLQGNSIRIEKEGDDFEIRTEDGAKGLDLISAYKHVKEIAQLPATAPIGFRIEIVGAGNKVEDNFWLEALRKDGDDLIWAETLAPETYKGFTNSTLPYTLVRESINGGTGVATFVYYETDWEERDVGDDDSNPYPSFLNTDNPLTVKRTGLIQNRVFFLAGEAIVTTRVGKFFDFFRRTTQAVASSDPIDTFSDSLQLNFLQSSAILDGDLILFSKSGQFSLPGGQPLSTASSLTKVGSYSNFEDVDPVTAGNTLFFAYDYGNYTGVFRMYTGESLDKKIAFSITEEVKKYITGKARQLETSTNRNWLVVLSESEANAIFVHNWSLEGRELVQSAWHKWTFGPSDSIEKVAMLDDRMYVVISRSEGVFIEYIDLSGNIDEGLPLNVRLDRKKTATGTRTIDASDHVTYTIPAADGYADESMDDLLFIRADGFYSEDIGLDVDVTRLGDDSYVIDAGLDDGGDNDFSDQSSVELIVGKKINVRFKPSLPSIRDRRGHIIGVDKLTVVDVHLNFQEIGSITVTVTDRKGNEYHRDFNGRRIGAFNNTIGYPEPTKDTVSFGVMNYPENVIILIESDDYMPFQFSDLEWRGRYNPKGTRI